MRHIIFIHVYLREKKKSDASFVYLYTVQCRVQYKGRQSIMQGRSLRLGILLMRDF